MTVGSMLAVMSSAELTYWIARNKREPVGAQREDLRAGIVAAAIYNVNIPKGKKKVKPTDFMPFRETKFDKRALFASLDAYVERQDAAQHSDD